MPFSDSQSQHQRNLQKVPCGAGKQQVDNQNMIILRISFTSAYLFICFSFPVVQSPPGHQNQVLQRCALCGLPVALCYGSCGQLPARWWAGLTTSHPKTQSDYCGFTGEQNLPQGCPVRGPPVVADLHLFLMLDYWFLELYLLLFLV